MQFGSPQFINPQQPSGLPQQNPNLKVVRNCAACGIPAVILIVLFSFGLPLLMVGMFVFGWGANLPIIGGMVSQGTVIPPGDMERFDPITTFAEVQAYAGENAKLATMKAELVNSDGTMNLKARYGLRRATMTYYFFRELSQPPANAAPIGAGGSTDGKWYEPISVTISHPGESRYMQKTTANYSFKGNYMHQGMEKNVMFAVSKTSAELIPPPSCPFKPFWDSAIKQGAPKDSIATIDYTELGYVFKIADTDINLKFGSDCQLLSKK